MAIDMSGMLEAAIEKSLQAARDAEAKGDSQKAAGAYRQLASLYKDYSRSARSTAIRLQRMERSSAYTEKAKQVAAGVVPSRRSVETPSRPTAGARDSTAEEASVGDEIEPFILRSTVTWEDVGGLVETKQEIKRSYALALARKPVGVQLAQFKAMLLYGPPGTGKTQLAAATSNGLDATFFNVKLSAILSKYFGESSKMLENIFAAAREKSPSVLFFDEIDSIAVQRTGAESGAERRVLTTFLTETEGMATKGQDDFVFLLGATNVPWLLDQAVLSRFQRRVMVPLPDFEAREAILEIHLGKRGIPLEGSYSDLAALTQGYSGRELGALCNRVVDRITAEQNPDLANLADSGAQAVKDYSLRFRPIVQTDFVEAVRTIKPGTSPQEVERYHAWEQRLN